MKKIIAFTFFMCITNVFAGVAFNPQNMSCGVMKISDGTKDSEIKNKCKKYEHMGGSSVIFFDDSSKNSVMCDEDSHQEIISKSCHTIVNGNYSM